MLPIRVLVVEDHDTFRQGVCRVLGLEDDIEVVGEARTGAAAVEMAATLAPDVVVTDLELPEMDGIEVMQRIHQRRPLTKVVVLTVHATDGWVARAMSAGATAFLLKTIHPQELVAAVRVAAAGEATLSPVVATQLLQHQAPSAGRIAQSDAHLLRRLAAGEPMAEIARTLGTTAHALQARIRRLATRVARRGV